MEKAIFLPAGEISARPEGYIHLTWGTQSQDSEAAQAVFNEVLCVMQRTGYRKLLTDQRQRSTASEEYMGWLLAIWLPQAGGEHHLSHVAVVMARPLDLRLQTVDVCLQGQHRYGVVSRFFNDPETAREWILTPS